MLGATVAMYYVTNGIIGTTVITTAVEVRQVSPKSCLLLFMLMTLNF